MGVEEKPRGMPPLLPVSIDDFLHHRYTTDDGLPGNAVQAVLQSASGYLWVGTSVGLSRFDGARFVNFNAQNTPAFAGSREDVTALAEDAAGTLWIGLYGGLVSLREGRFSQHQQFAGRFILDIEPAEHGALWLATFSSDPRRRGACSLVCYDPAAGRVTREFAVPGGVRDLKLGAAGLWVVCDDPPSVYFLPAGGKQLLAGLYFAAGTGAPILVSTNVPRSACVSFWSNAALDDLRVLEFRASPQGPLFGFQLPGAQNPPARAMLVLHACVSGDTSQWLGGAMGLVRIHENRGQKIIFKQPFGGSRVACLSPARGGGIWFGTAEDGLHFLEPRLVSMHYPGGTDATVRSVAAAADGTLWACTHDGLFRFANGAWSRLDAIRARLVTEAPPGLMAVGLSSSGSGALRFYNSDTGLHAFDCDVPFDSPGTAMSDRNRHLWVTSDGGLARLDAEWLRSSLTGARQTNIAGVQTWETGRELPSAIPFGLLEDGEGGLWIGSQGGFLARLQGSEFRRFTPAEGFESIVCAPRIQDSTGAIWIVGNSGVTRYFGGQFRTVTTTNGLPENTISDLLLDDEAWLWMAGRKGVHGIAKAALDAVCDGVTNRAMCVTLSLADGLATPECTYDALPAMCRTKDGLIWVALAQGLASFNPRAVRRLLLAPPVAVEQFTINHQPQWPAGGAAPHASSPWRLPPGSGKRVEIRYSAIVPSHPQRILFRHRLLGYDPNWSEETDLPVAIYTNLRPGEYRFEVTACDHQGSWNPRPAGLAFSIRAYYWQTTWFVAGCGFVVATGLLLAHRSRIQGLRRLQEFSQRQTLSDERARIAADMHDDLGAALTQIAIMSEVARSQLPAGDKAAMTLLQVAQASREVTGRMSDIVWATNPHNDTLEELAAHFREFAARHFDSIGQACTLDFPASVPRLHVSATFRRNALLVLKEAASNATRHSGGRAFAVRLRVGAGRLNLVVSDNGKGLPEHLRSGGLGLAGMRKRAADLQGRLTVRTLPNQGTSVELDVPLP